ncbi:MAG: tRNA glutamyl-Q(34) synthetase GluQRS [Candidatus Puniceispirillaceae bacterium]
MAPFHTRFAPSPTGPLHRGHIYAAQVAHHFARDSGGKFTLRIDDIDHTRCRDQFVNGIYDDLRWLGLTWDGSVPFQTKRLAAYQAALKTLQKLDLVYPCFLSRKELADILTAPHGHPAPASIRDTDKLLPHNEQQRRAATGTAAAWRLRMDKAQQSAATRLSWHDYLTGSHRITPEIFGDAVIARGDIGVSYHLAVVVDDALDHISLVTRGIDLAPSTHLHRLLQALLGLPAPDYLHHELVCDAAGKRLAKRDDAESIAQLRDKGLDQNDLLATLPALPALPRPTLS